MCYHVSQRPAKVNAPEVRKQYGLSETPSIEILPRAGYHVAGFSFPKLYAYTGGIEYQLLQWGLIPFWVKDITQAKELAGMTLNAQSETAYSKPSFRAAMPKSRCIIPVEGFYEWMDVKGKKYPHYIYPKAGPVFHLGCISEEWTDKHSGEVIKTVSILTTSANPLMAKIHNVKKRMPLILNQAAIGDWVNASTPKEQIESLLVSFPDDQMQAHTISKLITSRSEPSDQEQVINIYRYSNL